MQTNTKNIVLKIAIAGGLLFIGLCIYYFYRLPILIFSAFDGFRQLTGVSFINQQTTDSALSFFCVYCLPDALWYLALLLIQTIFNKEKGLLNRMLIIIAYSLPFLLEIFQYFNVIAGTFDWYDMLTYFLTLILFLCVKKLFLYLRCKS